MPGLPPVPSAERLAEVVAGMAGRPVLMNVDLVADRFVSGVPRRVSREAPVVILEFESERFEPGGGANAVANVAALGGRPLPLGVTGTDENGRALRTALAALDVPLAGIAEQSGYRTPAKTRILGGGHHGIKQQIVRYDMEDHVELDGDVRRCWSQALEQWSADGARVAVLSDYGYGAVDPQTLDLLRPALTPPAIVVCDSRHRLTEFSEVDGATPNEEEAEAAVGEELGDDIERVSRLGEKLRRALNVGYLLITRGSRGMSLITEEGAVHVPVHGTDQVADVTGAGDTVIGTFALALAAEAAALEAALLANYAGGVVVQKLGTATVSAAELIEAIGSDPHPLQDLEWVAF